MNQSVSLVSDNTGKKCSECETFSKCRSGFCPKTETEVSRDHPACQMFTAPPILGDWHRKTTQPNQKNTKNHDFGIHLKAYKNDSECNGPDPEYCTVYCSKYWNCQLVLNEVMKR